MRFLIITISLFFFLPAMASAQLTATATKTDASCPSNGSITIQVSGGTSPYSFSINGGATWQSTNVFTNLSANTYNVIIRDAANATFNINAIVVQDVYNDMQPTASTQVENCYGSNTGSITLSMPSNQGTSPYTYSISTDGTNFSVVSANNSATSYKFNNLAPGKYYIRVQDACMAYQTREATLMAANNYALTIHSVYARPNSCLQMDYYVTPSLGLNYPHTFYAYPNGNLSTTPYTMTVTASNLVTIPGTNLTGFKFTLPNPATFTGSYYTFKYTDVCVTDVTNPRVIAKTQNLGDFRIAFTSRNCQTDADIILGEGWKLPASVVITPTNGGTTIIKTVSSEAERSAIFSGLTNGLNYTVKVSDECNRETTQTFNMFTPVPAMRTHVECGGTIPGTANLSFDGFATGWQSPVTATINSGPGTFYSADLKKAFVASYPIVSSNSANDPIVRFYNLAPGIYNITFTDGCINVNKNVEISDHFFQPTLSPALVTGCSGSRVLKSTAYQTCQGSTSAISADVKKGTSETVFSNGQASPFSISNVSNDVYSIYYYKFFTGSATDARNVFKVNSSDLYNGALLLKKETIQVTDAPTNPKVASVISAKCTDGTIAIQLVSDPNTAAIKQYQIETSPGSGVFTPYQASPNFTVSTYGTYAARMEDSCGNSGISAVSITAHPKPEIIPVGNTCLGGDINLRVEIPLNATAEWTKPNGTKVSGNHLLIQNASEADKGTYTVKVTYKVGSCTEVAETKFILDNCFALPVNWGKLSAIIKNGTLIINWSTLKEINNSYFEIQASKDGKIWKPIGKVNSLAHDGNSDVEIEYLFQNNLSDIIGLLGIPALLTMVLAGYGRKNKYLKVLLIATLIITGFSIGCKKQNDTLLNNDKDARIWIRVVQVDIDGQQKTSGIVQAVNE